ncbi:MAG: anion permease [Candidatus Promineifilaceae bacterium]|jgi:PiT family inorganic phosphate transporter
MSNALAILGISAIGFGLLTGFHNSANIVATPIASRAIKPRQILLLAAAGSFIGPFLFGLAVAEAIGTGITDPQNITLAIVIAGTLSAVLWGLFTWWRGIPSSSSHALIGGLVGAIIVAEGFQAIYLSGLMRIGIALLISPLLGLVMGYLVMKTTIAFARGATPRINTFFKHSQLFSSFGLALTFGTNDAQKTMGIITLGLVASGLIPDFVIPNWAVLLSALSVSVGVALGGRRLISTLGYRIVRIRPVHGFVSQVSAALVVLGASLSGGPVSTTQVISASIMGAGSAERVSKVHWDIGYQMLVAWLLTVPVSGILAAILYFPLNWLLNL